MRFSSMRFSLRSTASASRSPPDARRVAHPPFLTFDTLAAVRTLESAILRFT
jgi:hypothetical protein